MSKIFYQLLIVVLLFLGIGFQSFAQGGKPQYLVMTKRADTVLGTFKIELFPLIAPLHVENFNNLVQQHFYDSTAFHRVIPGFVIQGGDPNSRSGPRSTWGFGNPSQPTVDAEFGVVKHVRGILSAARSANINSATSQFFICVATAANLNGQYSAYGKVVEGMQIVDKIVAAPRDASDNPLTKIEMFITKLGENDSAPQAPILLLPANRASVLTSSQALTWQPVSDAVLYAIEVSRTPDFATTTFFREVGSPTTSTTVAQLQLDSTYYWRVKANNGGKETLSEVRQFTYKTTTAIDPSLSKNNIQLFDNEPNPTKNLTTIQYFLPTATTASLIVYNYLGKELAVLKNSTHSEGEHSLVFDTKDLTNGVYFYQLKTPNFIQTKKMVVVGE